MKKQPDGYCAWHPESGWDLQTVHDTEANSREAAEFFKNLAPADLLSAGWKVKPIYIVDASSDSTEVVVPRTWLKTVVELLRDHPFEFPAAEKIAEQALAELEEILPEEK